MEKHTPGPWGWNDNLLKTDGFVEIFELFDEAGEYYIAYIVNVYRRKRSNKETIANARLIAASPDLFEALKDAEKALERFGIFEDTRQEYVWLEQKIDKALTKARGE